jgi:hypothetical protein
MKEKLIHIIEQLSLRMLFTAITFIVALYMFGLLTDEVIFDGEEEFDAAVFHFLADDLTPGLIRVMHFFSFFGKPVFLIIAYVLLVVYFTLRKKKQYAIEVAIMGGQQHPAALWPEGPVPTQATRFTPIGAITRL